MLLMGPSLPCGHWAHYTGVSRVYILQKHNSGGSHRISSLVLVKGTYPGGKQLRERVRICPFLLPTASSFNLNYYSYRRTTSWEKQRSLPGGSTGAAPGEAAWCGLHGTLYYTQTPVSPFGGEHNRLEQRVREKAERKRTF